MATCAVAGGLLASATSDRDGGSRESAHRPAAVGPARTAGADSREQPPQPVGLLPPKRQRTAPWQPPPVLARDTGSELSRTTRPVAPGTRLTSFSRLRPDSWLHADALSVQLGSGSSGVRADYLSSGKAAQPAPVTKMARRHAPGPGRRTVAAFNADFFDIDRTGAPLGPAVNGARPTGNHPPAAPHSPAPGTSQAVGVGPQAAGRILDLYFAGTVTLPGGSRPLGAYNAAAVPAGGIGAYNSQWGTTDRRLATGGDRHTAEVTVRGGRVVAAARKPGRGRIGRGETVLLGRGAGATELGRLRPGARVSWEYRLRTGDGSAVPRTAVGGRGRLVVDGRAQNWEGRPNNAAAPRTAVGFSRDGGTMHVLTVDGRQAASGGVTLTELGRMMRRLGAYNALNLDGGGSSTLLAREPGGHRPQLVNHPSDGAERDVPNGLALTAPAGSGTLRGIRVRPTADPAKAPTGDSVPGGHPERVFPGLSRKLSATGYDETYGPAPAHALQWRSAQPGTGRVDGSGAFHAQRPGTAQVSAAQGEARGSTRLTVLGALQRIRPTSTRVSLPGPRSSRSFGLLGSDREGTSAPVEPRDVELHYDRSQFTVVPKPTAGGFTVRAKPGRKSAAGVVTVRAGGRTAHLAVTVGLRERRVADLRDAARWTFSAARGSGQLTPQPRGPGGGRLRMAYDFRHSGATRAAYASPPGLRAVPGRPQRFTLWLKGDGHGAWPSLELTDAAGTAQVLRGPHVTWRGWRKVTFRVPEGVAHPLRVRRIYLAETRPTARYRGAVGLGTLHARTPPDVELPAAQRAEDPLISTAADAAGRDWRFALLSDAQFVARDPHSRQARQARRTLREVRAARPDFVLVNGDLVDEGSPADLRFARRMLTTELGDAVPWYYVPGNHEVMGGSSDAFVRQFGATRQTFDHRGTRFVTLDTSALTVRGGGYAQFRELRARLAAAARDRSVSSVVVVAHVPPRDPAPGGASQLTDRMEADLLERQLSAFHRRTGKGVAFLGGHTGAFHASRVGGVPYLINGNAGKAPSAPPGRGGFTGWTLLGVDGQRAAAQRRHGDGDFDGWLTAQTRARVDGLTLRMSGRPRAGRTVRVAATVLQRAGASVRRVPVRWPLSSDWRGSPGLCVTGQPQGRSGCVASFDPASGRFTGHRPGSVTLTVTVNGERVSRRVPVRS